jgi:hypothetical protein
MLHSCAKQEYTRVQLSFFLASSLKMASKAPTAMGRSIFDDTSTIKSDADSTLATEDTYPLRHESDIMLVHHKSTSHSEHSRVYTDEEEEENNGNDNHHQQNSVDDDEDDDDRSWENSKRKVGNEGSSVNTGSTYEETPFLPRKHSRVPRAEQRIAEEQEPEEQSKSADLVEVAQQQTVQDTQSWDVPEITGTQSKTDDHGGNGYAFEMILETQNMFQQAKTKAGDCLKSVFHSNQEGARTPSEASAAHSGICGSLQNVVSACGDRIDGVLIKFFNAPESGHHDAQKQAVSVNDSLTNDYNHVLQAAVKSEHDSKRSKNKKKKSRKTIDEYQEQSPAIVDTFLVPIGENGNDLVKSESDQIHAVAHDGQEEHSDIRDDLDDVLAETYDEFGAAMRLIKHDGSHDSMTKFQASIYANFVEKRESTSTASSIVSDTKCDQNAPERDGGSDSESVARVLEKYFQKPTRLEEERIQMGASSHNENESASDLSWSAMHQKHVQKILHKNNPQPSQDKTDDTFNHDDDDGDSVGDMRLSTLHGKHVVNLINKNLDATNRTEYVDLSHLDADAGDDDELLLLDHYKLHSLAGRLWRNKSNRMVAEDESTGFDFDETDAAADHSSYDSSFVDEIDATLHKRKEKLRKMMDDLSQTMDAAVNGKKTLEKRQDVVSLEQERGVVDSEVRTDVISVIDVLPEQVEPIDLTQYTEPIDLTLYEECY